MSQLQIDTLNGATASSGVNDLTIRRPETTGHEAWPFSVNMQPLAVCSQHLASPAVSVSPAEYCCPGETHAISRSIHLARLSSFYSKCRECPHRGDIGHHSLRTIEPLDTDSCVATRTSLLETDGVRGIYLNELDRTRAANWGAALASVLWDDEPRSGRVGANSVEGTQRRQENTEAGNDGGLVDDGPEFSSCQTPTARRGPAVVIAFDERPASPDIVTGVALGLRRMGCQVIDLGQTTTSCFQFAVQHLDAAAGMFVTGAGCDPAWTGFDVVGRGARPWSRGHKLEELEARSLSGVMRPTRAAGSQRTFQSLVPYEAGLWKHFHALRPLHVVCGSATKLLPRIVDRLFAKLPCRVNHVSLPMRRRDLCDQHDSDVRRVASAVISGGQHLGLIIDDDGQQCVFVTERGKLVTTGELARILINFERHEHHRLKIVLTEALTTELSAWLLPLGVEAVTSKKSAASVTTSLVENGARLGAMNDGRVWFGEAYPTCDAIVTLARVLKALSLSDATFGEVVSQMKNPSSEIHLTTSRVTPQA